MTTKLFIKEIPTKGERLCSIGQRKCREREKLWRTVQDRRLLTKKNDQKTLELETGREMERKDEKAKK